MTRAQEIEKALADLVEFERARDSIHLGRRFWRGDVVDVLDTRDELVRKAEHALRPVR